MKQSLKWRLAQAISRGIYYSGLLKLWEGLWPRASEARLIILCYHRVTTDNSTIGSICLSPENFKSQMAYLAKSRFRPITIDQWIDYCAGRISLEGEYVLITFDDGYRDNCENAYPILKECGVPATIFLATSALDTQCSFWWDRVVLAIHAMRASRRVPNMTGSGKIRDVWERVRIAATCDEASVDDHILAAVMNLKSLSFEHRDAFVSELERLGRPQAKSLMMTWEMARGVQGEWVTFGSHTVTHPFLSRLNEDETRWELAESKTRIEQELERPALSFAYPNGKRDDYNQRTLRILAECGYKAAVTTEKGINRRSTPLLELYRIGTVNLPAYVLAVRLIAMITLDSVRSLRGRRA